MGEMREQGYFKAEIPDGRNKCMLCDGSDGTVFTSGKESWHIQCLKKYYIRKAEEYYKKTLGDLAASCKRIQFKVTCPTCGGRPKLRKAPSKDECYHCGAKLKNRKVVRYDLKKLGQLVVKELKLKMGSG